MPYSIVNVSFLPACNCDIAEMQYRQEFFITPRSNSNKPNTLYAIHSVYSTVCIYMTTTITKYKQTH